MTKIVGLEAALGLALVESVHVREASEKWAEKAAAYWQSIAPVDPDAKLHPVEDLGTDVASGYKASIVSGPRKNGPGAYVGTTHALALPLEYGNKITERHAPAEQVRAWLRAQGLRTS